MTLGDNLIGRASIQQGELFKRLHYEPHAGQQAVHQSLAARRVLACGARWGKSTCGAMEAVAGLLQPAESTMGWIVAPSYDLSQRIFRQVERTVRDRFPHRVLRVDAREHRLVVRNLGGGVSELRGKSTDRVASLLGEACDWLIVDEAARVPVGVWDGALSQRLIDRNGWALLLSTPAGPGWFREMFLRGQDDDDPSHESWASPSWENPHLDRRVIEAERSRLAPEAFDQEYGAVFVGAELEPCGECRGPSALAPGLVVLREGEEPLACPACERAVAADGSSLVQRWPDGEEHLKVIRIVRGPAFPEPAVSR